LGSGTAAMIAFSSVSDSLIPGFVSFYGANAIRRNLRNRG
jgi:hypothetical protein